jgi:hypothetical protein
MRQRILLLVATLAAPCALAALGCDVPARHDELGIGDPPTSHRVHEPEPVLFPERTPSAPPDAPYRPPHPITGAPPPLPSGTLEERMAEERVPQDRATGEPAPR